MEIAIQPHELEAAAAALNRGARDLNAAIAGFVRPAEQDALALGVQTVGVSARSIGLTMRAVHTLATDLARLADGLRELAAAYPDVDRSAMPQP